MKLFDKPHSGFPQNNCEPDSLHECTWPASVLHCIWIPEQTELSEVELYCHLCVSECVVCTWFTCCFAFKYAILYVHEDVLACEPLSAITLHNCCQLCNVIANEGSQTEMSYIDVGSICYVKCSKELFN